MLDQQPRFLPLAAKTVICNTLTYFLMGALAFHFLHYADFINKPNSGMRPTTSPLVFMGPALQVFREFCLRRFSTHLASACLTAGTGGS
jgi:hypothetical protein